MTETQIEERAKRIETIVKIGGALVIGFIVAPFVFVAIKGLVGMVAATIIGIVGMNFVPYFSIKMKNLKLKALKAEASKNPIETLENTLKEKQDGLNTFRENINVFAAELQNFASQFRENKKKMDADAIAPIEEQYEKMKQLLEVRERKYQETKAKIKQFEIVIEQKRTEWNMALAAQKMTKAAGVGEDFMAKLMSDTALNSVQTSLNKAFAELRTSLLDEQELPIIGEQNKIVDKTNYSVQDLNTSSQPNNKAKIAV